MRSMLILCSLLIFGTPAFGVEPPGALKGAVSQKETMPRPFGIALGEPLPAKFKVQYQCAGGDSPVLICPKAPKGLEGALLYAILLHKGKVAKVQVTFAFENAAYGVEARSRGDKLTESLSSIYGTPQKFDFLREGSIWKDPRDYATSLAVGDRVWANFWEHKTFGIEITMRGTRRTEILLDLKYSHVDLELDRKKESEQADSSAL